MRPNPENPFSTGSSRASSGCAYLPCAFACQISIIASFTGVPSASIMCPVSVMRWPLTPSPAMLSSTSHVMPMCRYGPIVWEELVCMASAPRGQVVLHRRLVAAAQHDVELVAERLLGNRGFPVEMGDQAPPRALVGHAVEHGIVLHQRIAGEVHLRDEPRGE